MFAYKSPIVKVGWRDEHARNAEEKFDVQYDKLFKLRNECLLLFDIFSCAQIMLARDLNKNLVVNSFNLALRVS